MKATKAPTLHYIWREPLNSRVSVSLKVSSCLKFLSHPSIMAMQSDLKHFLIPLGNYFCLQLQLAPFFIHRTAQHPRHMRCPSDTRSLVRHRNWAKPEGEAIPMEIPSTGFPLQVFLYPFPSTCSPPHILLHTLLSSCTSSTALLCQANWHYKRLIKLIGRNSTNKLVITSNVPAASVTKWWLEEQV